MNPTALDNLQNNAISRDEPFNFHCLQCGRCCKNREDILLNPYDLYRISKELNRQPREIIKQYCEVYIGETSRFPCVLLKQKGKEKVCPFLKKTRCIVHKNKPTVCALFPLGKGVSYSSSGEDEDSDIPEGEIIYFLQDVACGKRDEQHTISEWLEAFNLQESEEWFLEWSKQLNTMSFHLQKIEKYAPEKVMQLLYNKVFADIYLGYSGSEDFMIQFRKKAEHTLEALSTIAAKADKI